MTRLRRDGMPVRQANKRKLTEIYIQKLQGKPQTRSFLTWDTHQPGLVLSARRSGYLSYKVIYSFKGTSRWYTIGKGIGLAVARKKARDIMDQVALGADPAANRKADREDGITFETLATRYVDERAKKKNRSWKQADALVRKHLIPQWGKLDPSSITRDDVKRAIAKITATAPIVATQTLAAASAIFNWAIEESIVKDNPCFKLKGTKAKAGDRVLSDSEIPKFWAEFDNADLIMGSVLKMILLTGQRISEVCHMRYEYIKNFDGWWHLPGAEIPDPDRPGKKIWSGTKNKQDHRVWLSAPARDLIAQVDGGDELKNGFVFATSRGRPVDKNRVARTMRLIWEKLKAEGATSPGESVRPHDLRRTFASRMAECGCSDDEIDRILNHKKKSGVRKTYNRYHYTKEDKNNMDKVVADIMALVRGEKAPDNVVPFARELT
jgi:integrase